MDLSQYLQNGADAPADAGQQLSKEEYAAMKKQEREEVWAEVDSKAQEVFRDGESLKGFLNFMARCKPQKAANLLLLYSQNPEIRQVKTFDGWKKEHKTLRAGAHGYTFIADQKYEKDVETRQGYVICKAYDISEMVVALSDMLRLSLNKGKNTILLQDELRQVDSYITLQKVRYSNRFSVRYEVEEGARGRRIIKMLLQPIVENAIVHGFEDIESGGMIVIGVTRGEGLLHFSVRNNGALIDLEKAAQRLGGAAEPEGSPGGYGIRNVNERIKGTYGAQYGIRYAIRDGMTGAEFSIPEEVGEHD